MRHEHVRAQLAHAADVLAWERRHLVAGSWACVGRVEELLGMPGLHLAVPIHGLGDVQRYDRLAADAVRMRLIRQEDATLDRHVTRIAELDPLHPELCRRVSDDPQAGERLERLGLRVVPHPVQQAAVAGHDAVLSAYNPGWTVPDLYDQFLAGSRAITAGVNLAAEGLLAAGPLQGLVIDVRENSGGYVHLMRNTVALFHDGCGGTCDQRRGHHGRRAQIVEIT